MRRAQVADQVEPRVDLLARRIRAGHQEARAGGQREALDAAPGLRDVPAGARLGAALVDEDDGRRTPDRHLLEQRPDPRPEPRLGRRVAWRRELEEVRDPVASRDERVIGALEVRVRRQDSRPHEAAPERQAKAAAMVVAGFHAHGRRVEPHEQQASRLWRQVGQGLDGQAVQHERDPVALAAVAHRRKGRGWAGRPGPAVGKGSRGRERAPRGAARLTGVRRYRNMGPVKMTVELDADLYRAIRVEAARADRSVRSVLEEALAAWLERLEDAEDAIAGRAALADYERTGGVAAEEFFLRHAAETKSAYGVEHDVDPVDREPSA